VLHLPDTSPHPIKPRHTTFPPTLPLWPSLQTTFGIDYPSPQALSALKVKQDQLEKQRNDTQVSHKDKIQHNGVAGCSCTAPCVLEMAYTSMHSQCKQAQQRHRTMQTLHDYF
jgi:hypothetical protein